jgi:hypothetical protein
MHDLADMTVIVDEQNVRHPERSPGGSRAA